MNREEVLRAAVELEASRYDDVPENAITLSDYMDARERETGKRMGRKTAACRMQNLVDRDGWNTGLALRPTSDGRRIAQRCYWPSDEG